MTRGEAKVRRAQCQAWLKRLDAVRGDQWEVCGTTRSAWVQEVSRGLVAITIVLRELVVELAEDARRAETDARLVEVGNG